jgi:hypothetical protein
MPREQVVALLGNAADELVADPKQTTDVHALAADHPQGASAKV